MIVYTQCKRCGRDVESEQVEIPGIGLFTHPKVCTPCREAQHSGGVIADVAEEQRRVRRARWETTWRKQFDGRYLDTVIEKIPHATLRSLAAMEWDGRSFLMIGKSGIGKTRSAFKLLESVARRGGNVALIESGFVDKNTEALKTGVGQHFLRPYLNCDLLLIDDFMQERVTEGSLSSYFYVIDHRSSHRKPLIITTNYTGHEWIAKKKDQEKRIRAIISRVEHLCSRLLLEDR